MSKPLIGVILGAVLGVFDGLTAWFTPAVRDQLGGIVLGSTIKGIIAGVAIGFFAKKFHSLPIGILFGVLVGAFLASLVAITGKTSEFVLTRKPGDLPCADRSSSGGDPRARHSTSSP